MAVSPARVIACRVLLKLAQNADAFAAEALGDEIAARKPSDADMRLASAITYLTLRNAYLLDYQYRPLLRQAPSRLSEPMRVLLRMAACQKHLMSRLPDHAIANETVDLARRTLRMPAREVGFLNAVVRGITAAPVMRMPAHGDADYLRNRYSMPDWLIDVFRNKVGEERLEALLASLNEEPRTTLRRNRLVAGEAELGRAIEAMGGTAKPGLLSPDAVLAEEVPLRTLIESDLFSSGAFYLQDEGSQAVAYLVGAKPGNRVLDLCAAPGGKTTHVAELAAGKANVTATDPSEKRLALLHQNLERLRTPGVQVRNYQDVIADAGTLYDHVLVDAPCSGLGTLRRNPEIRYRCTAGELRRLADQQLEILQLAAGKVAPGGHLVYSTCTVTDEENAQVIQQFLAQHPEFSIGKGPEVAPAIAGLRCEDGWYRTWPNHLEVDGFEAIVLQRHLRG